MGHYLMRPSLGTPPVDIHLIADTGSDLIWTQCLPCDNCYTQSNPMFDPHRSSTYTPLSCTSPLCHVLDDPSARACPFCNYTYAYASTSVTRGVLSKEKLSFNDAVSFDGVVFGCGHNDTGSFNDREMGIMGLGGGPLSLVSQLGSSFGLNNGLDGAVSTPLVPKEDKTYYYVTLKGISVGPTYLPFNARGSISEGNMFIDSGTPPTILPQDLYDRVVGEVRRQVTSMKPIEDDPELGAQLCYRTEKNIDGPNLKAHFEGGDVELGPIQTFVPPKDGVFCFGMTNTSSEVGVYGNFAQSNYLIGRATYSSHYDKNLDEISPTVVPEDVIQAAHSDKYWAPHPQTGVFGPPTDHISPSTTARGGDRSFYSAPTAGAGTTSVLEEKAWFRHTGLEDLEKPHFLP
ncbi:aspartic proteinase CDR1-like [Senna tora]|uniref:Aspartic proteinase CDR1-like n=1 Tax=Senna tora TaxID=362788 RepID=A0A835CAZ7_9FABA|nr:aspartic proteinase CDR1-like [Senna tora]